jgi:alanyl-tRNA synthetase
MTERLYYADAHRRHFAARVTERLTWDEQPAVVLDRTIFYPASGGQPADRGVLGGVEVVDVVAREDGAVVHVLQRSLPGGAGEIAGEIDWPRRFDHMQQHTGQHILSAAFEQVLDADTVGFHLGAEVSTIDVDAAGLDREMVVPVEDLANRVVWEDRPVGTRFVGPDELANLPLRRPPAVDGPVRIVDIANLDVNPCGGTHVARTGEIGLIRVSRLDHRGDETRVEFLCGGRALHDYRARSGVVDQLATRLTVGYWELDAAVERLRDEAKELRHDLRHTRECLLHMEASDLYEAAIPRYGYRVVEQVWEGRDAGELRALARELIQRFDVVALLASVEERTYLCFARSEGVDVNMVELLQEACGQLGGKGGGQPHLAQGSGQETDLARVCAVLSDMV